MTDTADAKRLLPTPGLEKILLGEPPSLTRGEVADRAGVPLDLAQELWAQLGFPHAAEDDVAFTSADVEALVRTRDLIGLGILTPDSQAAMVRTWGRSFARLAEWQVGLITRLAGEGDNPAARLDELLEEVLPHVEHLQDYAWRRHLAGAAWRLLDGTGTSTTTAVGFVDIVGYIGQSQHLTDRELVDWVEHFENHLTHTVVESGGRIIKTIGDEVLYAAESPAGAVEVALEAAERGTDEGDAFPQVRAGVAYGDVVSRLGDVLSPTVNIAARLTSLARPGTVLIDRGAHDELSGDDAGPYVFRRVPRTSVKGYSRLEPWVVRRAHGRAGSDH